MEKYKLNAVIEYLADYDILANKDDVMEVVKWEGNVGYDVYIYSENEGSQRFSLSKGQFKLLKKLIKTLNYLGISDS